MNIGVCRYGQTVAAGQEGDIMFVPQRPYMVLGSLREQVLYPTWATSPQAAPNADSQQAPSADDRHVTDDAHYVTAVFAKALWPCLHKKEVAALSQVCCC